jgi:5'-3' exonuclease
MENSTIKHDAETFAAGFVPHTIRAHEAADYQAAYEEGAKQVLRYLQQFAGRVNANTPWMKETGFQAGQVDGVLWAVDHISTLFGIE